MLLEWNLIIISALFWCRIWNNVNFVGIYLFSLHHHTAPTNINIWRHSLSITPKRQKLKYVELSGISWSWWKRYWIRYKSPGFRESLAIHYCNQAVWSVVLDLNVVYSIFWLLISFQGSPWYCLVCYVLEITTTVRGLFVTY